MGLTPVIAVCSGSPPGETHRTAGMIESLLRATHTVVTHYQPVASPPWTFHTEGRAGIVINLVDPVGIDGHADTPFYARHHQSWIAAQCEAQRIPYVGFPPSAAALCADKWMTKRQLKLARVPTPDGLRLSRPSDLADLARDPAVLHRIPGPWFLRPAMGHGRFGIGPDSQQAEVPGVIEIAEQLMVRCEAPVIVDTCLRGEDYSVFVIGDPDLEELQTYGPIRVADNGHVHFADFRVVAKETRTIDVAKRAYEALGCRDWARVDFVIGPDHVPYVVEVDQLTVFDDRFESALGGLSEVAAVLRARLFMAPVREWRFEREDADGVAGSVAAGRE